MELRQRLEALATHVCDPLEAGRFRDEYGAILSDLRAGMEAGTLAREECRSLALLLRHLCVGRMAWLAVLHQREAQAEAAQAARMN